MPAPLGSNHRPQSLVFALMAEHVLDRDTVAASQGVITVLSSTGVGEHAARTTLTRMARRDLLSRHRRGRKTYLGLTQRSERVLRDGNTRLNAPVDAPWDGSWSVLRFSVPDTRRQERHSIQARLQWAGFGQLDGLWISPHEHDINELLGQTATQNDVIAMRATTMAPLDNTVLISRAFDLESLKDRYDAFLTSWQAPTGSDALTSQLRLNCDWLEVQRADPRLPLRLLPSNWPAAAAQQLYHETHQRLADEADRLARSLLDLIIVGTMTPPQ